VTRFMIPLLLALVVGGLNGPATAEKTYITCALKTPYEGYPQKIIFKFHSPLIGSSTLTEIMGGQIRVLPVKNLGDVIHYWQDKEDRKKNDPKHYEWINLITGERGQNISAYERILRNIPNTDGCGQNLKSDACVESINEGQKKIQGMYYSNYCEVRRSN
jgi:hypothetical protein